MRTLILKEEEGFSLIEVVASIVILSVILLSVFGILIQSNKVTRTSQDINSATYTAQVIMEDFYQYAKDKNNPLPDRTTLDTSGFKPPLDKFLPEPNVTANEYKFTWTSDFTVHLTLKYKGNPGDPNEHLTGLLIKVFDKDGVTLEAQMESVLDWG